MNSENNKRIAKNTLMLYFRMLFVMGVSLYTSRVVLSVLGVSDFGIYNIVGGVVILFSFVNNAMSSATQRFLNFEMGRNNSERLKKVFSISLTVHFTIAVIAVLLTETIGLWFVNNYLNVPHNRMDSVLWVYQLTILSVIVKIVQVPFNASIIAHEKMSINAYISIVEATIKLAMVFLLQLSGYDKLRTFSVLMCLVSIIIVLVYIIYCKSKFTSCSYKYYSDKLLYKQLLSFSAWSLLESISNIGKTQGINILINLFCGVVVNAAMGIANQASLAIYGVAINFQVAFNPQIVKYYAANEKGNLIRLIFRTSKFSYFLLYILTLPVILNINFILKIWLGSYPQYTVQFCQLMIICLLIESISGPLWMAIQATGIIKKYQLILSGFLLMNVPLSYLFLKLHFYPYSTLWVNITITIMVLIVRINFVKSLINIPVLVFLKEVILPIVCVTILSIPLPYLACHFIENEMQCFIFSSCSALFSILFTAFKIGLTIAERKYVVNKFKLFPKISTSEHSYL